MMTIDKISIILASAPSVAHLLKFLIGIDFELEPFLIASLLISPVLILAYMEVMFEGRKLKSVLDAHWIHFNFSLAVSFIANGTFRFFWIGYFLVVCAVICLWGLYKLYQKICCLISEKRR
jgi:hypothetical protein